MFSHQSLFFCVSVFVTLEILLTHSDAVWPLTRPGYEPADPNYERPATSAPPFF